MTRRVLALATTVGLVAGVGSVAGFAQAAAADPVCSLNSPSGTVQHVIYVQFDNTHFTRDNPTVPSDLEQMPNLLNFIQSNGTMLTNHHTPLISHTGTDILTSLTGLYAAGEDTGGVHGANRLGGNGVANSTVFGGLAGDSWRHSSAVQTGDLAVGELNQDLGTAAQAAHRGIRHHQRKSDGRC